MRAILVMLFLVIGLIGCVPSKRVNLFQGIGEAEKKIDLDTVVNRYNNIPPEIYLQPGDLIGIHIGSLTAQDYDFVLEYTARLGVFGKQIERTRTVSVGGMQGGAMGPNSPMLQQLYGFEIDEGGNIELPYIGATPVLNKTTTEAAEIIRDSLMGVFKSPIVRVEYLSFNFTVMGEVARPDRYTSYSPELAITDAILMAGNFTEFSDRKHLKIVRTRDGGQEVFYLNLLDENTLANPNYFLRPGDMIIVPQLKAKVSRDYTLPNSSFFVNLLSSGLTVYIIISQVFQ